MRFTVLGSGSTGNAVLISSEATNVLVDAGMSAREIVKRLAEVGVTPDKLDGIMVTHEHGDHVGGLRVLMGSVDCPVYISRITEDAYYDTRAGGQNGGSESSKRRTVFKDRTVEIEHGIGRGARAARLGHRGGAARKDHAFRLQPRKRRRGALERVDFAVVPRLPQASRNQLRDLGTEIDDQDGVDGGVCHGGGIERVLDERKRWRQFAVCRAGSESFSALARTSLPTRLRLRPASIARRTETSDSMA